MAKMIARVCDAAKRLIIIEIVKLAFALGIKLRDELVAKVFANAAGPLVKISVNDDLVSLGFKVAQPRNQLWIFRELTSVMIIRDQQERTGADTASGQFGNNFLGCLASRGRDIVDRDDQRMSGRARCRHVVLLRQPGC